MIEPADQRRGCDSHESEEPAERDVHPEQAGRFRIAQGASLHGRLKQAKSGEHGQYAGDAITIVNSP